ncbi:MAG: ABC transporter ATP-binding protein [Thermomicrobiales bacterium]
MTDSTLEEISMHLQAPAARPSVGTTTAEPLIRIEGVSKRFNETVALETVDLDIADGEMLILLGPSGSGKTTLLRIIAGLESATEGRIVLAGRDVTDLPPEQRNVSMVFQDLALYPHMTAFQNIAFPLEAKRGRSKAEIRRQVEEKAAMVGIGDLLNRRIGQLSGGQRQRVALARALVREPTVFLMDEAFSSLDAILRREFRAEFKRFQRRLGVTMIHVTHDQEEAMTMGDRVVVFDRGRLVQVGSPVDLFLNPATLFVARFVGTPPMNVLPCVVTATNGFLGLEAAEWSLSLPPAVAEQVGGAAVGTTVTLAVRSQHLQWSYEPWPDFNLETVVDVVEPVGTEEIVHCRLGDGELQGLFKLFGGLREGDRAYLHFRLEDALIFGGTDDDARRVI